MKKIVIKSKNDGSTMNIANGHYRTIVSGKETQGSYAIIEMKVPPGAGPGPHAHNTIEELFYVVEGTLEFFTGSGNHNAQPGDLIRIPTNGGAHAFKNSSDKSAILICTVYPAGLDEMFEKINQNPENAKKIGEAYGNSFFPPDYFDKY